MEGCDLTSDGEPDSLAATTQVKTAGRSCGKWNSKCASEFFNSFAIHLHTNGSGYLASHKIARKISRFAAKVDLTWQWSATAAGVYCSPSLASRRICWSTGAGVAGSSPWRTHSARLAWPGTKMTSRPPRAVSPSLESKVAALSRYGGGQEFISLHMYTPTYDPAHAYRGAS